MAIRSRVIRFRVLSNQGWLCFLQGHLADSILPERPTLFRQQK